MDAALYEELWQVERAHWWFQARRQIVWSLIKRYIHGASRRRLQICELGCGTGGNLVELAARHDVTGVECAPQAIEYARRRLGNRVLSGRLPDQISLPTGRFDVVLLTDVLEHIEDDARSAKTALRLLRPGGIVVATVPAYQWLYSPRDAHHHHVRRYGKMQFRRLWAAGEAELLLLSYYNTYLFPAAAGVRLMSKLLVRNSEPRDLAIPPRPVNGLLARLMTSEANLLGRLPMPFGLSLIAVVRKRAVAGELRFAA